MCTIALQYKIMWKNLNEKLYLILQFIGFEFCYIDILFDTIMYEIMTDNELYFKEK